MKAIVYTRYGSPDVLEWAEIEKPAPKDDEVVIRVRAASVNPLDWHLMRGSPYLVRMMSGLRAPRNPRLGVDVAGEVEAVGKNVTQFKPGDEVFGSCEGAFAESVATRQSTVVAKPSGVTFEQAASTPVAAITALQALRDKARIRPGQSVLINGAAGGVGTFAVQIAKSFGAVVTGVCSTRNVEMVRSIGADHAVDYTQTDFTRSGQRYDVILDCIGNHALSAIRGALNPRGMYLMIGGKLDGWIDPLPSLLGAALRSLFIRQTLSFFLARQSQKDLVVLGELLQSGTVTPVIDRVYGLSEVPEAIRYLEEGHARGKVVISTGWHAGGTAS
jgi:NADPH:quinone reductase-like Zn-dependent oxidoreductase